MSPFQDLIDSLKKSFEEFPFRKVEGWYDCWYPTPDGDDPEHAIISMPDGSGFIVARKDLSDRLGPDFEPQFFGSRVWAWVYEHSDGDLYLARIGWPGSKEGSFKSTDRFPRLLPKPAPLSVPLGEEWPTIWDIVLADDGD